ncbi:MAG: 4Fe-4S dicluster domain-containing protein [Acidimicrobiia bacterium]
MAAVVVDRSDIGVLFDALTADGYAVIGPTHRDDAIVLGEVTSPDDLPAGWTDSQDGGSYRLERRSDEALFGYSVGPHSPKRYLFPPRTALFDLDRSNGSLTFTQREVSTTKYAFIGLRACELAAIAIQDRVFTGSGVVDRTYAGTREDMLVVAVNCAVAGGTCFCESMGTGPRCEEGFDLVLTELIDGDGHRFVFESGSDEGDRLLEGLPSRPAGPRDIERVDETIAATSAAMGRALDTDGIQELLEENREHPRWNKVAQRCLACTNCTLVCPTCFCSTTEDVAALDGSGGTRSRRWDSCFTMEFSTLHGRSVRTTTRARYRQWMTHKLASWHDQFGSSGCVGCGRCITWCPVGIDITKEAALIRLERS